MCEVHGRLLRILQLLGLIFAILAGVAHAAPHKPAKNREHGEPEPRKGLTLRLVVLPQVGVAPVEVRVSLVALDPENLLRCPSYAWDWGDGCTSSEMAFCDPYGREGQDRWAPLPQHHRYRTPGEYEVRVAIADQFNHAVAAVPILVKSRFGEGP